MLCAVIADDLTGACDSAAQFAAAGLRTAVSLGAPVDAEVAAYSTDSRDIEPDEAVCRLRRVAGSIRAEVVFKKIDSTLRGNTAVEIAAALDAFGCEVALVNPAFPAMGRVVEDRRLRVIGDPSFEPIDLGALLPQHPRLILFDALYQSDLEAEVDRALESGRRVLWVGSAGMASALARRLGSGGAFELPVERPGPALFCIGSDHPVTVEQARRLEQQRPQDRVLRIPRGGPVDLAGTRPSALFLSGGDTAALVCRALGVASIDLRRELARGIPAGILRGGALDGTPVVTKSGGFGAPDDLIHIADYFDA